MMNYRKEASEQVSDANILEVGKYLFSKSQLVKRIDDSFYQINVNLSEGCVDPAIGTHLTNL
jgi:hypothetical protein